MAKKKNRTRETKFREVNHSVPISDANFSDRKFKVCMGVYLTYVFDKVKV